MPFILTLSRLLLTIPIMFLLALPNGLEPYDLQKTVFFLFVIAALTDLLDGWLARLTNDITVLGEVLDPIADKVLVLGTGVAILASQTVEPLVTIAVLLILLREIVVSGLREAVGRKGGDLAVTRLAKLKTVLQMSAFMLMLAPKSWLDGATGFAEAPLWILLLATAITLISGVDYTLKAMNFLIDHNNEN